MIEYLKILKFNNVYIILLILFSTDNFTNVYWFLINKKID